MTFSVWAPNAACVELQLNNKSFAMELGQNGWWRTTDNVPGNHGDRYAFCIDGQPKAICDPRSRWQPDGVHELSAIFDAHAFTWTDHNWTGRQLAGSVIYEMHVGTFTPQGTLDSAIERLDHLVSLGIDFVELLPVNAFNGTHNWGYDGVAWYAVSENYGGPLAYQRFVDACHNRNLAVIQDVVYNHLGPSGNYLPLFGPYLDESNSTTWGSIVNLSNVNVRRYILDNAQMWMHDYHVDGLRLDAVHALIDTTEKHLLQELSEETDALSAHLKRPLTLIAESDLNDPILITPREAKGYGLTAQWSDDYHHSLHVALTQETHGYYSDFESLSALAKSATEGFFHDGSYSSFRGRLHGKIINRSTPTWRLVTFAQNHDQIGNRASGDRLPASLDFNGLAIAAVLNLAGPFTPMLFMGEEWGASTPWQFFTSHDEPDLGDAVTKGRIAEFARMNWNLSEVPNPQDPETFLRSKLNWDELHKGDHAQLLKLYQDLAELRRCEPSLTDPSFEHLKAHFNDDMRRFALVRGDLLILANFGNEPWNTKSSGSVLLNTTNLPLGWYEAIFLAPRSATIARITDIHNIPDSLESNR